MTLYDHFDVERKAGITVIYLNQPALGDARLAAELKEDLLQVVELIQPERVLVDFSRVESYPSAAISSLLRVKRSLAARASIKFCGMCEFVSLTYRFLNLESVFDIYRSPEEAVTAFGLVEV